jgi:two-component system sensor histidine kinase KdpD
MERGTLRVYIGVAVGVGKTCALVAEAERRAQRGTDVVIGAVRGRGRARTEAAIDRLEARLAHPSAGPCSSDPFPGPRHGLDIDAVLERRPGLVVVDDLDVVNGAGARNEFRWQDVEELLRAGIDIISAVNAEHLESLADLVCELTGSRVTSTVPDRFVRSADQVELIDMDPAALRRRLAHGNVMRADQLSLEDGRYFRLETLAALRELALLWMADRVDEDVRHLVRTQGEGGQVETKTRVVVAMTGAPGGDVLIRRGARMSDRLHGELIGVHVCPPGTSSDGDKALDAGRRLLQSLGGRYMQIAGEDVAIALVSFVRAANASQLVIGGSTRSRLNRWVHRTAVSRVLEISDGIDVHVRAALPEPTRVRVRAGSSTPRRGSTSTGRSVPALAAVLVGIGAAGLAMVQTTDGGFGRGEAVVHVALLLAVLIGASLALSRLRRTEKRLATATGEAEALARLAGAAVLVGPEPLSRLVGEILTAFDLTSVAVLTPTRDGWEPIAHAGTLVPRRPSEADMEVQLRHGAVLVLKGEVEADDQRLLSAFVTQLGLAQEQAELEDRARETEGLRSANEIRDGLLMAVSHDLRTPLSTIKLSAASLVSDDVEWSAAEVREFAVAIEQDADRLNQLVCEVLDLSRLQAGALGVNLAPCDVAAAITEAAQTVPHPQGQLITTVTAPTPLAIADTILLERVLANLIANAIKWSPPESPVQVHAGLVGGAVEIRVADRGPGIPPSQRLSVFQPFQRLGDGNGANTTGLGLGLALARGFVHAMDGDISVEDTPGGGTTMVVQLERARSANPSASRRPTSPAAHGARL